MNANEGQLMDSYQNDRSSEHYRISGGGAHLTGRCQHLFSPHMPMKLRDALIVRKTKSTSPSSDLSE